MSTTQYMCKLTYIGPLTKIPHKVFMIGTHIAVNENLISLEGIKWGQVTELTNIKISYNHITPHPTSNNLTVIQNPS